MNRKCVRNMYLSSMNHVIRRVQNLFCLAQFSRGQPRRTVLNSNQKAKSSSDKFKLNYAPPATGASSFAFTSTSLLLSVFFLIRLQHKSASFTLLLYHPALLDLVICWNRLFIVCTTIRVSALQQYNLLSFFSSSPPRPRRAQHFTR
jgi:hypothetical protein